MIEARIKTQYPGGKDSAPFELDVQFRAANGVTVLFGPSGSGKTLTLDMIAGFANPGQGRILLDDRILFDAEARVNLPPRLRGCGYVFQNYALFPHMTLKENIYFATAQLPHLERHRRVNEALERFRLTDVAGRKPHQLSGGQKQRGSIVRALVAEPGVLLLDEPSRGLDAPLRRELYEVLREVRTEYEAPIVLVTHDLDECLELADQVLIYRDGKIVQAGEPRATLEAPASVDVARMLGIFNLLHVEILSLDPGRNLSRVRWNGTEIEGPYFPGHFLGDRITISVRPRELKALPRAAKLAPNQIAAQLRRIVNQSEGFRLDFEGDISVDIPSSQVPNSGDNQEWMIEFPRHSIRAV